VRLRPTHPYDRAWEIKDNGTVLKQRIGTHKATPNKTYGYDHVLEEAATNAAVYQKVAQPVVRAVSQGKHGTVFAYGQTSSGKTHTMQGSRTESGIVELAAKDLFQWIAETDDECVVKVQYFEIYNETVRDLLVSSKLTCSSLSVREDKEGNVVVNASEVQVDSAQAVMNLLQQGNGNRAIASTLLNSQSSRSHAIYRLSLERCSSHPPSVATGTVVSVLNLVDLAGSENSTAAAVVGAQKREGGKINQSLLALSRVVHALSLPEDSRPARISYRDSKLTRILQPHLHGGAACLALLCCVSGSRLNVAETKSTLQFASSAKQIIIRPVANAAVVDNKSLQLAQLQQELAETKAALHKLQQATAEKGEASYDDQSVPSVQAVFGESLSEPDELWSESVRSFVSASHEPTEDPPVPEVILIQSVAPAFSDDLSDQKKLEDSEQRAKNLEERLRASDALANTLFQNLKTVWGRYEELKRLNEDMGSCDDLEFMPLHSLLQSVAILASLLLLYNGQLEVFVAIVCFLFVSLEVATC
jgi:hypothetical protein